MSIPLNHLNPPSFKPTVEVMKEIQIFKSFTDSELMSLIKLGQTSSREPETNILIEGEPSWGLYIILSGSISILKTNKLNGVMYEVGQLHAGDFFGEMSFLDENTRSATVKTLTQSRLFYLSKEAFSQFIESSADIKIRFLTGSLNALVKRLRDLDDNFAISQYQLWKSVLQKEGGSK